MVKSGAAPWNDKTIRIRLAESDKLIFAKWLNDFTRKFSSFNRLWSEITVDSIYQVYCYAPSSSITLKLFISSDVERTAAKHKVKYFELTRTISSSQDGTFTEYQSIWKKTKSQFITIVESNCCRLRLKLYTYTRYLYYIFFFGQLHTSKNIVTFF